MIITPKTNVFLSGNFTDTGNDLQVIQELLKRAGLTAVVKDGSVAETTEQLIRNCEFFVAVIGVEEGHIKTPVGETLPQMELDMAIRERIPVVAFVKHIVQESPYQRQELLRRYVHHRLGESVFAYETTSDLPKLCRQLLVTIDSVAVPLKPNKVFLSHSSSDKPLVRDVADRLEEAGIATFFDEADIDVGQSLRKTIQRAISSVGYVLVFLSQKSITSDWVRDELAWALEHANRLGIAGDEFIVPVCLESVEFPPELLELSDQRFADLSSDFDSGVNGLISALMK